MSLTLLQKALVFLEEQKKDLVSMYARMEGHLPNISDETAKNILTVYQIERGEKLIELTELIDQIKKDS